MHIAILQCENLPSFITWEIPDNDAYFEDDRLLADTLGSMGHTAEHMKWSEQNVDWSVFDKAIVRSTWDYIDRREEFLIALEKIQAAGCRLFNPLDAIRWNSDKNYLLELSRMGVPIIPTYELSKIDSGELQMIFEENNWRDAIIKPVIGGGGAGIEKIKYSEIKERCEMLLKQHPTTQYLIQPLMQSVMSDGEWSFIFIKNKLSHVLLKKPATGDYRTHGIYGGTLTTVYPSDEEIARAKFILDKIPFDILYARLDLVKHEGDYAVMEIELIEPVLYFNLYPPGIALLAEALVD